MLSSISQILVQEPGTSTLSLMNATCRITNPTKPGCVMRYNNYNLNNCQNLCLVPSSSPLATSLMRCRAHRLRICSKSERENGAWSDSSLGPLHSSATPLESPLDCSLKSRGVAGSLLAQRGSRSRHIIVVVTAIVIIPVHRDSRSRLIRCQVEVEGVQSSPEWCWQFY